MQTVSTRESVRPQELSRTSCPFGMHSASAGYSSHPSAGVLVLDLIYVALTLALFALVGLVAKGVEKL